MRSESGGLTPERGVESWSCDLCVVEATPAGIACAVRAAREGLRVVLVNRTAHPGGMLASGLAVWDTAWEGGRAPLYDALRAAIFAHYRNTYGEDSQPCREALPEPSGHTNGKFEPRVAEALLSALIAAEPNLKFLPGFVPVSAERAGRLLQSMTFRMTGGANTVRVQAAIFADCTYEGDVLPLAGVDYRVGRESRETFGEPHAGRVYLRPVPACPAGEDETVRARHAALALRPFGGFQELVLPESTGEGDRNVQAFNYRTILTSDPDNRVAMVQPEGYDAHYVRALEYDFLIQPIPNRKIGWNRPQLLERHQAYVEGDWSTRQSVMDDHWHATLSLLYFLQHDPSVPPAAQTFWRQYGLPRDEFADNGHRPYEIYVREARRLAGRATLTQHDVMPAPGLLRPPIHSDAIAATDWYLDCHAVTRGRVRGSLEEGKMMLHAQSWPGQIPWRSLLPETTDNLLVPVCLSASHVAWGAIRLEATWMQLGEVAGAAAALAQRENKAPAALNPDLLQRVLARDRMLLTFFNDVDPGSEEPAVPAVQYFGTKGFFPDFNGRLDDPISAGVARVWAEGAAALARGQHDAMELARAVLAEETAPAVPSGSTRRQAIMALWDAGYSAATPNPTTRA
jgi:hypothetical protein